ncbi:MAG TPA: hypothetical protein VLK59_14820 [Solirubrobacteraceae bacterium]|nr:hypothetical protein [Solirubrobacteraceae bacterium]
MVLVLAVLASAAAARAADPLGLACADQDDRTRLCEGKVKTFDGVPLDANLALPAGSSRPLVRERRGARVRRPLAPVPGR